MDTACQAFGLRSLKPCQNRCHPDFDTCLKHRDFYEKNVWKDRFLNIQNRRFLLQGLDYSPASSFGRLQHILEFSLNSGKIVLTEPDVAAMYSVPINDWTLPCVSLIDVFTVMCGTGKILPSWNKRLLHHAIYSYFTMYTNRALENYVPLMELRLGRLLANPATSPMTLFRISIGYFNKRYLAQNHQDGRDKVIERQERFIKEALALPQMRSHLLLADEKIASYFFASLSVDERLNPFANNEKVFTYLVKPHKDAEKAKLKLRMRQYKEGIAMAVWHPKNVERWLKVGGWPLVASIAGDDGLA
jgi:hypothetical protein